MESSLSAPKYTVCQLADAEGDGIRGVRSFVAVERETRGGRNAKEGGCGERGEHGDAKAVVKETEAMPALRRYLREMRKEVLRLREGEEGSRGATSAPRTCPHMASREEERRRRLEDCGVSRRIETRSSNDTGGQGGRNNRGRGAQSGGPPRSRNPPGTQNCPPQSQCRRNGNEERESASQEVASSKSRALPRPVPGHRSIKLYVNDFEQAMKPPGSILGQRSVMLYAKDFEQAMNVKDSEQAMKPPGSILGQRSVMLYAKDFEQAMKHPGTTPPAQKARARPRQVETSGADATALTDGGKTPREVAVGNRQHAAVEALDGFRQAPLPVA